MQEPPPVLCEACGRPAEAETANAAQLCGACLDALGSGDSARCREVIESIAAPVLLMQPDPRLVRTANSRALALFGKELAETEAHRGGEVFNCLHSFSEAGCGKDAHCEHCSIRGAIVGGFSGDASAQATLTIRTGNGDLPYTLAVSARKAGAFALVAIDRFETADGAHHE